jgi:serine protease inhibitor
MKKVNKLLIFLLLLSVPLSGCTKSAVTPKKVEAATRVDSRLVEANTEFAFKLYQQLLLDKEKENIFFSPASISFALSMVFNGAAGGTLEAMAAAMGIEKLGLDDLNKANADLRTILLNPDPRVETDIANSLWAEKDARVKEDFLQRNKEFYDATVEKLDFSDPGAPDVINKWVELQTRGKIKKLIEELNEDMRLILVNALYFNGKWTEPFDKDMTEEADFSLAGGALRQVPMMYRKGSIPYYDGDGFKAVSIPYGEERLSMYIFVTDSDLESFTAKLSAENWNSWMSQFSAREVALYLPRFKADYDASLATALSSLGMGIAFSDRADFSAMTPDNNWTIYDVIHKATIEVDEEGTEAAAVTGVVVGITSYIEPLEVRADRPFFFAIRDDLTGTILFMGSIADPK